MKKVSWISVIFVCLAALFMIVSCTDPNNPGGSGTGSGGNSTDLTGTWVCKDADVDLKMIISGSAVTIYQNQADAGEPDDYSVLMEGTYTLSGTKFTFIQDGENNPGTYSGQKITINFGDDFGSFTFTKNTDGGSGTGGSGGGTGSGSGSGTGSGSGSGTGGGGTGSGSGSGTGGGSGSGNGGGGSGSGTGGGSGSGTGGGGSDPAFLRASEDPDYLGFNEIYFENYAEQVASSERIYVYRGKPGDNSFPAIYYIDCTTGNFTSASSVIDYYAEPGTTYRYSLHFYYGGNNGDDASTTYTTAAGLGEAFCTAGVATYSDLKLTFSTLPVFDNLQIDVFDGHSSKYVKYAGDNYLYFFNFSYDGHTWLTDGNKIDVWDPMFKSKDEEKLAALAGKTLTPECYGLSLENADGSIEYRPEQPITSGLPDITLPTEWPSDPAFLRASTNSDYQGFNEIYFDNYEEQVKASTYICVYRGESDSSSHPLLYWIRSEAGEFFECIPPLIDFYAVPGTEYEYNIYFSAGEHTEHTDYKTITTEKGNTPSVTPGNAVFNSETWDIEFSTVPEFNYELVSWFTSLDIGLEYVVNYDGTNWGVNLSLGDLNENKIFFYKPSYQGKIMKPEGYYLEYTKNDVGDGIASIKYTINFSDTTGIPEFTMP